MNLKDEELVQMVMLAEAHKHRPDPLHPATLYLLMQMPHVLREYIEARRVLREAQPLVCTNGSDQLHRAIQKSLGLIT